MAIEDLPLDVREALRCIPPVIWNMGGLPINLESALKGVNRFRYLDRFSHEGLMKDTLGKVVMCTLPNPTKEELDDLKVYAERTMETATLDDYKEFGDGVRYSARHVRCVIVESIVPPPKELYPLIWPCGLPTNFGCPVADEEPTHTSPLVQVVENYHFKVDEGLVVARSTSTMIANVVASLAIRKGGARTLAKKGIDCGEYLGWITQEIYDEAAAEWTELRARFNLYSGIA